ncbi:hypothetical protein [Streptomyces sp. NPDC127105]|uniref:hypothetical protein n=1 Tax=Streptomyces sp. NPDC127105 TaxID=3345359 RepID=UPI003657D8A7
MAIARADGGHQPSYGGDVHTERLGRTVRGHSGPAADVHPVLNGTGANVAAPQAMLDVCQAVICTGQPKVVSLTQCTGTGLHYTVDEIHALCEQAHGLGLLVHMDGARGQPRLRRPATGRHAATAETLPVPRPERAHR